MSLVRMKMDLRLVNYILTLILLMGRTYHHLVEIPQLSMYKIQILQKLTRERLLAIKSIQLRIKIKEKEEEGSLKTTNITLSQMKKFKNGSTFLTIRQLLHTKRERCSETEYLLKSPGTRRRKSSECSQTKLKYSPTNIKNSMKSLMKLSAKNVKTSLLLI